MRLCRTIRAAVRSIQVLITTRIQVPLDSIMADDERLRLRSTVADLLSPDQVNRDARGTGTGTVHDEPVVGGGVKGDAGQDNVNVN